MKQYSVGVNFPLGTPCPHLPFPHVDDWFGGGRTTWFSLARPSRKWSGVCVSPKQPLFPLFGQFCEKLIPTYLVLCCSSMYIPCCGRNVLPTLMRCTPSTVSPPYTVMELLLLLLARTLLSLFYASIIKYQVHSKEGPFSPPSHTPLLLVVKP